MSFESMFATLREHMVKLDREIEALYAIRSLLLDKDAITANLKSIDAAKSLRGETNLVLIHLAAELFDDKYPGVHAKSLTGLEQSLFIVACGADLS